MYDLVHLYREVLDALPEKAVMIGFSFGGWIAAEVAARAIRSSTGWCWSIRSASSSAAARSATSSHFFNTTPGRACPPRLARPGKAAAGRLRPRLAGGDRRGDAATRTMIALARNWDALCLYAWRPHMYNPQLKHWLRRIAVPTLVLWGDSDGIVTPDYGRAYAGLIPGARFELIEGAGPPPRTGAAARLSSSMSRGFLERSA